MAVPSRPSNRVLDTSSAHYNDIVSMVDVSAPAGGVMTAQFGTDLTIQGTEGVHWDTESDVLGGMAIRRLTTGALFYFDFGVEDARPSGTAILVARKRITAGGPFYTTNQVSASNNGALCLVGDEFNTYFILNDGGSASGFSDTDEQIPTGVWTAIVVSWQQSGPVRMAWTLGESTVTVGDGAANTGVVVGSAGSFRELLLAGNSSIGGFIDAAGWDFTYSLRLGVALDTSDIADYLANPFLNWKEQPAGDVTPPVIVINNETPTEQYAPTVIVGGSVSDTESVIDQVVIDNNGGGYVAVDSQLLNARTGFLTGIWEHTITLTPGSNIISVKATDTEANEGSPASIEVVLLVDATPPTVTITAPEDESVSATKTITVEGTASEADSALDRVEVRLNSGAWVTATGTDTWSLSGVILANGVNTIEARAFDTAENESDIDSITVTYSSDSFDGNHGAHWKGVSATPDKHWTGVQW